jgi:hypothetical protein
VDPGRRERAVLYYGLAMAFVAFGLMGILTIGLPFLLSGLLLIGLGPVRHRRDVLWPPLVGVWVFAAAYVLAGPLGCASSGGGPVKPGLSPSQQTTCSNPIGFDYSGGANYNPPLMPAVLAGVVAGSTAGWAARRLLGRPGTPVGS